MTVLDQAEAVTTGTPNAAVGYVAMGLIIAFCPIAVVNTLAMSTLARSRELAVLRVVGTTRRQAARMLRTETLRAVGVAVAIGTSISLATLAAFSAGMTGSALPYAYLAVVTAVVTLALAPRRSPAGSCCGLAPPTRSPPANDGRHRRSDRARQGAVEPGPRRQHPDNPGAVRLPESLVLLGEHDLAALADRREDGDDERRHGQGQEHRGDRSGQED